MDSATSTAPRKLAVALYHAAPPPSATAAPSQGRPAADLRAVVVCLSSAPAEMQPKFTGMQSQIAESHTEMWILKKPLANQIEPLCATPVHVHPAHEAFCGIAPWPLLGACSMYPGE